MKSDHLIGGALGLVTILIGGWSLGMRILLILVGVDVLTGILKAWQKGSFTSREFRQGLISKLGYIALIIVAYQLDLILQNEIPMVRDIVVIFYIAVEGSSIIENLGLMGVPIPDIIAKKLKVLNDSLTDSEDDEAGDPELSIETNIETLEKQTGAE